MKFYKLQAKWMFLNLLKTSEGDVPANIKNRMERIENKEYVVLSSFKYFDRDRSRDHCIAQINHATTY